MQAYIFFPYKAIWGHIYGICGHIDGSAGIYMASAGIYMIYMPADPYICPQMPYICPHMTSFEGYIHQYSPQAWIFWISKLCIVGGFWAKKIIFCAEYKWDICNVYMGSRRAIYNDIAPKQRFFSSEVKKIPEGRVVPEGRRPEGIAFFLSQY